MKKIRSNNKKSIFPLQVQRAFLDTVKFSTIFLIIIALSFFSFGVTVKDLTLSNDYLTTSQTDKECVATIESTTISEKNTTAVIVEETKTAEKTTKIPSTTAKKKPSTTNSSTIKGDNCYYRSLGVYKITAYCACSKCCGQWANNRPKDENGNPIVGTASGAIAKPNHTIGVNPKLIPYGSVILIDGIEYTAEDTGAFTGKVIDVYCASHEEALKFGCKRVEIFLKVNL